MSKRTVDCVDPEGQLEAMQFIELLETVNRAVCIPRSVCSCSGYCRCWQALIAPLLSGSCSVPKPTVKIQNKKYESRFNDTERHLDTETSVNVDRDAPFE